MREADSVDARASSLPSSRDGEGSRSPAQFLQDWPGRRRIRGRHPARPRTDAGVPEFSVPNRAAAGEQGAGHGLSPQRSGSRIPACHFSCGAASQTTSCSTSRSAESSAIRRCLPNRFVACSPIRVPRRWWTISPLSGCRSASWPVSCPTWMCIRSSMRTCARRCSRKRGGSSGSQLREDRSVMELLTANYTFVNERLAQHYGIPNVYGNSLSASDARGWKTWRPARPRQHADGNVLSQPNLASAPRQVGSRKPARRAAAAAARRCSAAEGRRRGRSAPLGS